MSSNANLEYEKTTVVTETGRTAAQLREAFEKVQNEEYWKNPIRVIIPNDKVEITVEAIRYFLADEPQVIAGMDESVVSSKGYQAW